MDEKISLILMELRMLEAFEVDFFRKLNGFEEVEANVIRHHIRVIFFNCKSHLFLHDSKI
jgi:hypothetical protein